MKTMPIETWDDIDAEMHVCEVLSDMVWDLASEINYDGPPSKEHLDRLIVLSSVAATNIRLIKDALHKCGTRRRSPASTAPIAT